ncbi:MAG: CFI-box-CTERM domain-containing protein [Candidatus Brocadiia bacterium]
MKKLFLLAVALVVFAFPSSAFAATTWDFSQNWDSGYSYGTPIYSSGSPWSSYTTNPNYPCYNTYGADVDGYNYASYYYAGHVGMPYSYYGSSYFYDYYLIYTWPTTPPGAGTMTFWYYCYYASLDVQYTTDGSNWYTCANIASNYSYIYGANTSVEIPGNVKKIRFHTYTYDYYYYGLWVDNIVYTMKDVWVTSITGYDSVNPNAGILNLTATAGTIYAAGVNRVDFLYKGAADATYTLIKSDTTSSDGFTCAWDTDVLYDPAMMLRAIAYSGSTASPGYDVKLNLANPGYKSFGALLPIDGQNIILSANYQKSKTYSTWPDNPWTATNNGAYIQTNWNTSYSSASVGTFVGYKTYFNYVYPYNSPSHSFKIITYSGGTYSVAASGPSTASLQGEQSYTLTGTAFANIAAGAYIGVYMYYCNAYGYTGNNNSGHYYGSDVTSGAFPYYNTYTYYAAPVRATVELEAPYPTVVQFGYSTNKTTVTVVGSSSGDGNGGYSFDWQSLGAVDDANVWMAVRGSNGYSYGKWYFSPAQVHVINRVNATFNTSMNAGALTFQGISRTVPFVQNVTVSWENTYTYSVAAPQYQIETPQNRRYRFDNWSDGGAMSHSLKVTGDMVATNQPIVANYVQQYWLATVSPFPVTAPIDGYYDTGYRVISNASQLIDVTPFKERYFCEGWTATGVNLASDITEANFLITSATLLTWKYRQEFTLIINNDQGVSTGDNNGWYEVGTTLHCSVDPSITNGNSRMACGGYTGTGSLGSGSTNDTGMFQLNAASTITWIWQGQYYVSFSSNLGATSPTSGWFNVGTVVPIYAIPPADSAVTKYTFNSWAGTGAGSTNYAGPDSSQSITVNGAITQHAEWQTWHMLTVVAENGTIVSDPSGWQRLDASVLIRANAPAATAGQRWVAEWFGADPAVVIPRDPANAHAINVSMSAPIEQHILWSTQYLLTVTNTNPSAEVVPPSGASWHYSDEPVVGYAQSSTATKVCSGFAGTGSTPTGTVPYCNFLISQPSSLEWLWSTRPGVPEQFWNMPEEVASDALYLSSKLRFDGDLGLAYYSPSLQTVFYEVYDIEGTQLSSVQVLTGLQDCQGLALGLSFCDKPLITFYNGADHHLYFLCHDTVTTPGWVTAQGWAIKVLDDSGDVGRISTWDTVENNSMIMAYFDSSNAQVKVRCMGGAPTWAQTIPYDGMAAMFLSVAVRPNDGEPVVVFFDASTQALVCSQRKAGVWTTEIVDDSGVAGFFCKVRTSPSGEIYIAYQDASVVNSPVIKVARKTTDAWTIETADANPSGYNLDFALDAAQHPHILSSNGLRFRYARHNGTSWETMTIPNPIGIDGNINVHIGPSGKPVAFYAYSNKIGYMNAFATSLVNIGSTDSGNVNPTGPTGGGSGCFIATAAFGSMSADVVRSLTTTRDALAAGSATTSSMVELYYLVSPAAAATLRDSGAFRAMLRELLAR